MSETYDCIVLGVGGFGSSALYHLARRGVRALGLERFGVAHDRGSSHGETRIIRKAYFEHPDYVPLLKRAYELWSELEAESGQKLYSEYGLLIGGPADHGAVPGALLAARLHGIRIEEMCASEATVRFPGFRFPPDDPVVFEPEAGALAVEECVATHIHCAQSRGAVLKTDETVTGWSSDGPSVEVRTDRGTYSAASLIITAGSWAGQLLADLGISLRVVRKPVFWYQAREGAYRADRGSPTFFFDTPTGEFYGFPSLDGRTVKVAEHTGGEEEPNPLEVERQIKPGDLALLGGFIRDFLPELAPEPVRHSVCMYTKTPDCHFLVDRHPRFSNVVIGAGFSGHGFKFTSVLGEAFAELALDGRTPQPVEFLSLSRPGLQVPTR